MSINNIKLPAQTIAALYATTLVSEINTNKAPLAAPIPVSTKVAAWKYLGNNQKHVLIIVQTMDAVHLPDSELSFLTGILSACKLSMADVAILNRQNHPAALYKELVEGFNSKVVILFGLEPAVIDLPLSFPQYQVQPFIGTSYLHAPPLNELENNKEEKMKLWMSLKRIFEI